MVKGATLGAFGGLASYVVIAGAGALGNAIGNIGLGNNQPFIIPNGVVRGGQGNFGYLVSKYINGLSNTVGNFVSNNIGSIAGMGGGLGSSTSDIIKEYYIARNGTPLSVDQYKNYETQIANGTAEGWMIRRQARWEKNISIDLFPNPTEVGMDLSKIYQRFIKELFS